jgi:hypothetical protein
MSTIEKATSAAQNPLVVMQRMQEAAAAGGDPQAVMATLSAGATAAGIDWTDGIAGREGMLEPRYVVLAEDELFGQPIPSRVVAIFQDEAMGATSLIFRSKPPAPKAPDVSTPEGLEAYMRLQKVLGSLDARVD